MEKHTTCTTRFVVPSLFTRKMVTNARLEWQANVEQLKKINHFFFTVWCGDERATGGSRPPSDGVVGVTHVA